jgi:hypothetical protein
MVGTVAVDIVGEDYKRDFPEQDESGHGPDGGSDPGDRRWGKSMERGNGRRELEVGGRQKETPPAFRY